MSRPTTKSSNSSLNFSNVDLPFSSNSSLLDYLQSTRDRLYLQRNSLKQTLLSRQQYLEKLQQKKLSIQDRHVPFVHQLNEHYLLLQSLSSNYEQLQSTLFHSMPLHGVDSSKLLDLLKTSKHQLEQDRFKLNELVQLLKQQVKFQVVKAQDAHDIDVVFSMYKEVLHTWLGVQLEIIKWSVYKMCLNIPTPSSSSSSSSLSSNNPTLSSFHGSSTGILNDPTDFFTIFPSDFFSSSSSSLSSYLSFPIPSSPLPPVKDLLPTLVQQVQEWQREGGPLHQYAKLQIVDPFLNHVFEQQQHVVQSLIHLLHQLHSRWCEHGALLKVCSTWMDTYQSNQSTWLQLIKDHHSTFQSWQLLWQPTLSSNKKESKDTTSTSSSSLFTWFSTLSELMEGHPVPWSTPSWTLARFDQFKLDAHHYQTHHQQTVSKYVDLLRSFITSLPSSLDLPLPSLSPRLAELATQWTLRIGHLQAHQSSEKDKSTPSSSSSSSSSLSSLSSTTTNTSLSSFSSSILHNHELEYEQDLLKFLIHRLETLQSENSDE